MGMSKERMEQARDTGSNFDKSEEERVFMLLL